LTLEDAATCLPTYAGTIGKIAVRPNAGVIAGEACVSDGAALREALAKHGPAAAGFTVWDTAQPKPY
jgi:hypothetical protein